jgi:hypothetical protein
VQGLYASELGPAAIKTSRIQELYSRQFALKLLEHLEEILELIISTRQGAQA